ncbi:DegV family protein [Metabacillus herbersteinensis]|uniref:DegV family protein n=1 Tax=Metabacillus herbersteinensis TaxID=283816 RepID=A0ABV6GEQ9_9BACI
MTKKKIAWITDSTVYLTKELSNHPDVYVVPMVIIFGEEELEDGINLTTDELYRRIKEYKQIPKTSQPSNGKFAELFEKLKNKYDHAIAIHVSGKLSGTLASCQAGSELAGFPVETVDSKSLSYSITTLINQGIDFASKGLDYQTIATKLRARTENSERYMLLGNLDQFYKGGRMSGTSYLLGNILQIKPIIKINKQGEFELFEKVRSEKKASKRILEIFDEFYDRYTINEVQIMHGNVFDKAISFEHELKSKYPQLEIVMGEISSTIAVHAGEGTVGLLWENEEEK